VRRNDDAAQPDAGANTVGHRRFTLKSAGSLCHSSRVAMVVRRMSGTTFTFVTLAILVGVAWAIYYFQFSGRAINRVVNHVMSEPRASERIQSDYWVVITEDGIACEHPKRPREFIRWADVREISVRTTSDGPWSPDMWVLLVGDTGGCSIPTEAPGFDAVYESLKRFHGFDFGCFLNGGTNDALHICWKRSESYV
jgi:hypothetical protein